MTSENPGTTALLVMDVMPIIVPAFGGDEGLLERINVAIGAAKQANIPVMFGRVAFRSGYPDVSPANPLFSSLQQKMDFTEPNTATDIHPELDREPEDIVFIKRRVSAFTGSDLDVLLRSHGVGQLILSGVSTSGVVLSTLRAAADLDYSLVVLEDACADSDDEVHRLLMERVFPKQATVIGAHDWVSAIA